MHKSDDSESTRGWNTYWAGARDAEAYAAGGVSHPVFAQFWDQNLPGFLADDANPRIVDIATGNGAVIERLSLLPGADLGNVTCVDLSEAAIDTLASRFPAVKGVVADARSLPLESGAYELVTSQFGIEYAGPAAISEAARLTAPGGSLLFLMHIRPGVIYDECAAALDAIKRTQACEFVPRSLAMFDAGFAAVRGADRQPYDKAGKQLAPAIQALETVLAEHGEQVAAGTIAKLYSDVGQIHGRIQHYEPEDVLGWLRTMGQELEQYEKRMASMCEAATDEKVFLQVCEDLRGSGFDVNRAEALMAEAGQAMAWVLSATRRS